MQLKKLKAQTTLLPVWFDSKQGNVFLFYYKILRYIHCNLVFRSFRLFSHCNLIHFYKKMIHYATLKEPSVFSCLSPRKPLTELRSAVLGAAPTASRWWGRSGRRPSLSAGTWWPPARTAQSEPSPLRRHGYTLPLCIPQTWEGKKKTKQNVKERQMLNT